MSDYENRKSHAEVQRALWTEWDPIGLRNGDPAGPSDEYDGYALIVRRELNSGSGEVGLARLLRKIETESMGLRPSPFETSLGAARRIRAVLKWRDPKRGYLTGRSR